MKIFFTLALIISSTLVLAQKIKILDAETREPIPYAKIILNGKDYYKNTEKDGEIVLEKDEQISSVEYFGYENLKVEKYKSVYFLKPKFTEITEVQIAKPKYQNNIKIGSLKTYGSFGGGINRTSSAFLGKVITFNNEKNETLFIKKISFKTISYKPNTVIRIMIYENVNGLPGEILQSEEITCKAGINKLHEFFPKQMRFPKEGIVVGFEWILNENNLYETTMKMKGSNESKKVFSFYPQISGSKEDTNKDRIIGVYNEGKWHFQSVEDSGYVKIKYNPAIQLELTN